MLSTIFRAELARAKWWATFPNRRHPPERFCMKKLLTCSNNSGSMSSNSSSRSITSNNSIRSSNSSNQAPTAEQHLSRQCRHHPASALSPRPGLTPPLWSTIVDTRCVFWATYSVPDPWHLVRICIRIRSSVPLTNGSWKHMNQCSDQCSGSMTFRYGSGSVPLTNGSGSSFCSFRQWPSRCQQK